MDHLSRSALRAERGWTDGLIAKWLGEPDKTAVNPHYKAGPRVQLFSLERVIATEGQESVAKELDTARSKRTMRSASARVAAKTRALHKIAQGIPPSHEHLLSKLVRADPRLLPVAEAAMAKYRTATAQAQSKSKFNQNVYFA